jgi:fermentation-respiration switch protein FrsA (DUF1100 family)
MYSHQIFKRSDFTIQNSRGEKLACSFYEPIHYLFDIMFPVVVYLHGNSSSRAEALPMVNLLLTRNILLFLFDMSGSGHSEGDYVTIGVNEVEDLRAVIAYLREIPNISSIALWGRSMGAVTALRYGIEDF